MDAYFHSEPRIEEWVNQIIDNIVTLNQLDGIDSELEFEKGREIVTNLTFLLQGISVFPPEYLEEGLKQLLEQQLPSSQAINIVAFQETMNKMLREGMMRAINTQNKELLDIPATFEKSIPDNTIKYVNGNIGGNYTAYGDENIGMGEPENELVAEIALSALASVKVNEPVDHLKNVLGNMFPDIPVLWNQTLMGQTFLAQVEDILIWPHDLLNPSDVAKLNKEGWKVYECSSNDLMFPRRLERGIRQVQRQGKGIRGKSSSIKGIF